jgi:hypothetical protein
LFPDFNHLNAIQGIREKYDPLAHYIAPHITVVFPFESDLPANALKRHCGEALKGVEKFRIGLKNFTGDCRDGYLFLNVKRGNDQIIELHDRLYSGILGDFCNKRITYCPHLTVGRLQEQAAFDRAVDEISRYDESFETVVEKVSVENINAVENSITEFSIDLI